MNNDKDHIEHLSLEELKNYLGGILRGKEANEVERHLSNCELCSDALLGLEKMDPKVIAEDVSELRSAVKSKSRLRNRTGWTLRIAAAIILLFISTFFLIDYLRTTAEQKIASANEASENEPQESETLPLKESNPDSTEILPDNTLASSAPPETSVAQDAGARPSTTSEAEIAATQPPVKDDSLNPGAETYAITKVDEVEIADEEALAEPIAQETLAKQEEVLTEETKQARKLSEGVQAAKPQSMSADALRSEPAIELLPLAGGKVYERNAEPLEELERYKRSLLGDLKYPAKAAEAGIKGFVMLRFKVNSDGILSDFMIISGLGFGCDEEAIRIVSEGPAWKAAMRNGSAVTQEVEVKIPFNLTNR